MSDLRLLETGETRLLETGFNLLLETSEINLDGYRLLETNDFRLLETSARRALEGLAIKSPFFMGFGMSKKIGKTTSPDPLGVMGIYQMRMTKRGKVPIKMKYYVPTNPRTELQQANRTKFAEAMTAWHSLTDSEKLTYNKRARHIGLFGRNLFIREYYPLN